MVVKALNKLRDQTFVGPSPMAVLPNQSTKNEFLDLVIFGAGAAGVAAALEAQAQGLSFALIEKGAQIPGGVLTSVAPRFVSVGMYEWPHLSSQDHGFPIFPPSAVPHSLILPGTSPLLIVSFAKLFGTQANPSIKKWKANATNMALPNTPKQFAFVSTSLSHNSKNELAAKLSTFFELEPTSSKPLSLRCTLPGGQQVSFKSRWVVYAVGFERESQHICTSIPALPAPQVPAPVYHLQNPDFWSIDYFDYPLGRKTVLIIGSGDGALQDAFRFCVLRSQKTMDPHSAWNVLEENFMAAIKTKSISEDQAINFLERGKKRLAEAEMYTTGHNMWHVVSDANYRLDLVVREQIAEWLKDPEFGEIFLCAVKSMLRNKNGENISLTLIRRGGDCAPFQKCYLLNRTWAWLLHAMGAYSLLNGTVDGFSPKTKPSQGGYVSSVDAKLVDIPVGAIFPHPLRRGFDIVILRAGLQKADELTVHSGSPTPQHIGILPAKVTRLDLTRLPPPIRP